MDNDETDAPGGVSLIEASQQTWGKTGTVLVTIGLALLMIAFEFDNSTVNTLHNYSLSDFSVLSSLGLLYTVSTIVFAIVKVPIAKLSDVIGRGYTLAIVMLFYVGPYILMSSASSLPAYFAGKILSKIGQSGANVITTLIISDITTPRQRGLAINFSYFPFLITPWVSGFIVDSLIGGIGWRWGVRAFAVAMPLGSALLVVTLVYYQIKVQRLGLVAASNMTVRSFCSGIDLGGVLMFMAGFALFLCPLSIAGSLPGGWLTPWVPALVVVGVLILAALPVYEKFVAAHPMLPTLYFRNATIMLSMFLMAIDYLGYTTTHTYIYAWGTISYNMSPRDATFFSLTALVTQVLFGILAGWVMYATSRYKWLTVGGTVVRLLGYGLMYRLRAPDSGRFELFFQQILQGVGTGIIHSTLLVPPQIVVSHAHTAQVLSLTLSMAFLGKSVGSAIAGGIYTNTMRPALWQHLGADATPTMIEDLYNSITKRVPAWGTPQRNAVSLAYIQVTKNFAHVGVATSVVGILVCLFLPNLPLPDTKDEELQSRTDTPRDVESIELS